MTSAASCSRRRARGGGSRPRHQRAVHERAELLQTERAPGAHTRLDRLTIRTAAGGRSPDRCDLRILPDLAVPWPTIASRATVLEYLRAVPRGRWPPNTLPSSLGRGPGRPRGSCGRSAAPSANGGAPPTGAAGPLPLPRRPTIAVPPSRARRSHPRRCPPGRGASPIAPATRSTCSTPTSTLEADLSIDSIKRIEIIGELAERIGLDSMADDGIDDELVEELAQLKSLREIVT